MYCVLKNFQNYTTGIFFEPIDRWFDKSIFRHHFYSQIAERSLEPEIMSSKVVG